MATLPCSTSEIRELARQEAVRRGLIKPQVVDTEAEPVIQHGPLTLPLHRGQLEAWSSTKRIVAVFAGWQSGKTVLGPWWLRREMQRRGPGDYAVIAPNYPLLDNKARPEILRVFGDWLRSSGNELYVTEQGAKALGWPKGATGRILLRHAERANAIEAFTALAIWVDEPGQIPDLIWESIQSRGAVHQARYLLTSRPYEHNWYIKQIWDKRFDRDDIDVINFRSVDNPMFPVEEYELQKAQLPSWKFTMKYDGVPTRPAGQVYDCFGPENECDPFLIPEEWPLFVGMDFGLVNTAAVVIAQELKRDWRGNWTDEPTGRYFLIATYHAATQATAKDHIRAIREIVDPLVVGGRSRKPRAFGGSHQESGWRESYGLSGLGVGEPPETKVDNQIARLYAAFKARVGEGDARAPALRVFRTLTKFLDEVKDFSYELDDEGEPTQKLADEAKYHRLAACRYIASYLFRALERLGASRLSYGVKA